MPNGASVGTLVTAATSLRRSLSGMLPPWTMGPVPEDLTDAEAFHTWLRSHLPLEWVGLRMMAEIFPGNDRVELSGRIVVPEGQVRIVDGDVTVDGDLLLEDGARVMVLGSLTVTGFLVAPTHGYSLVVADRIACRDGVTGGAIMALQSIHCPGPFFLSSDDHDSIAPLYTGGVLIDFMWPVQFDLVEVTTRVTGGIDEIDYDAQWLHSPFPNRKTTTAGTTSAASIRRNCWPPSADSFMGDVPQRRRKIHHQPGSSFNLLSNRAVPRRGWHRIREPVQGPVTPWWGC